MPSENRKKMEYVPGVFIWAASMEIEILTYMGIKGIIDAVRIKNVTGHRA